MVSEFEREGQEHFNCSECCSCSMYSGWVLVSQACDSGLRQSDVSRSEKSFMFRRLTFERLVCWILAAVIVFDITGACSLRIKQMLMVSQPALNESGIGLVSFVESISLTLIKNP